MFLEETGLTYRIVPVNINTGAQFDPAFHHFARYAPEPISYAIERYVKETNRLYGVLNKRLADRAFVAGQYSIADIAAYPWVVPHERQGQKLEDFPRLRRWFQAIHDRPATVRAYEKATSVNPSVNTRTPLTEEVRRVLFGQTARLKAR